MKGAFTLSLTMDEARSFAASLVADSSRIPYTFPIKLLAAPPLREALHRIAEKRGGALFHEGQTLAFERPLDLDLPILVDYALEVLDGPPLQVRLEAVVYDEWNRRYGTLSTLLRLITPEARS
jgi:hypothetical protein